MTIQLATNSFLQVVARSELLSPSQMIEVHQGFGERSLESASAPEIADWMVERQLITRWQADKLLQAKHRGFFLGPYLLLRRIARGGMSTIYAAEHLETGEQRALKVLPASRVGNASFLPRFFREAEIARRLQHPGIVRVYGAHTATDGRHDVHFLAMELLSGRDLFDLVKSDGPLPCRKAAEYIRQAATGLQYAHSAGLVHRDIKPGNLFLTDDGTIRIVDLGLAQDSEGGESLTREYNEKILGTADYLAPEQAVDSHTADARADIYGLGCTFYFLLTGKPPFGDGTLMQRMVAHQKSSPARLSSVRDDVPEDLSSLVRKMMEKNRDDRIQTAFEVAARLRDWLKRTVGQQEFDAPPQLLAPADASTNGHSTPVIAAADSQAEVSSPVPGKASTPNRDGVTPSPEELVHFLHVLDHETDERTVAQQGLLKSDIVGKVQRWRFPTVRSVVLVMLALLMYPAGILTAVVWPKLVPAIHEFIDAPMSNTEKLRQDVGELSPEVDAVSLSKLSDSSGM